MITPEMERTWKTHQWAHRIFSTILGVIITNAFLLYKYLKEEHGDTTPEFYDFVDKLIMEMINYKPPLFAQPRSPGPTEPIEPTSSTSAGGTHDSIRQEADAASATATLAGATATAAPLQLSK